MGTRCSPHVCNRVSVCRLKSMQKLANYHRRRTEIEIVDGRHDNLVLAPTLYHCVGRVAAERQSWLSV